MIIEALEGSVSGKILFPSAWEMRTEMASGVIRVGEVSVLTEVPGRPCERWFDRPL